MSLSEARKVVEHVARQHYGRLVAILASRSRDIAAAEDALSEAFASALVDWPAKGIPQNPEAWLLTAGRRRASNMRRAKDVSNKHIDILALLQEERAGAQTAFPDKRLELMFACAHPAIEPSIRTPLMLQAVLGLDAATISKTFLISPEAMGQRLVRAKTKIRDAGIVLTLPDTGDMQARLTEVLDAVYAAFGTGWDSGAQAKNLTEEAIFLARIVSDLLPEQPEPKGLLALMLYCEARSKARFGSDGQFIPLREQDASLWSRNMIIEAENLLTTAAQEERFGRYQCEAAIQSVHVQRAITGATDYAALLTLYDLLVTRADSIGARVARAAVLLESGDADECLRALDEIGSEATTSYQPYWVTRAKALALANNHGEASLAKTRALSLSSAPSISDFVKSSLV